MIRDFDKGGVMYCTKCGKPMKIELKGPGKDNAMVYKLACEKCGKQKDLVVAGRG